jgi:nitrate/nitrite transport system permease protein
MTITSPDVPIAPIGVMDVPRSTVEAEAQPLIEPDVPALGKTRARFERIGCGLAGFVVLGLAWQFASTRAEGLPGPMPTFEVLHTLLADGLAPDGPAGKGIILQLGDSLARVVKGFAMAAVIGVPAGFALGTSRRLHQVFDPLVQLLKPISPLAWFPICLTILVKTEPAAIWVIFLAALWPVVINTAAGAGSVPTDQSDVARVFRFSPYTRIREIVVPHALPSIITGLRLSMGVAWMVIVAAEMLAASSGIGFYIWQSYNGQGLAYVLSAVLLIGGTGVVLDLAFQALGRLVNHTEARS